MLWLKLKLIRISKIGPRSRNLVYPLCEREERTALGYIKVEISIKKNVNHTANNYWSIRLSD